MRILLCCLVVTVVFGCTKDRDTTAPTSTVDTVYVAPPPQVEYKDFQVNLDEHGLIECSNVYFAREFCVKLGYDDVYRVYCGKTITGAEFLNIITCERTR